MPAGVIAAGALALIYLAGSFFFAGHYFWRTSINGTDVSFSSREQVREELLNPEIYYELAITGRDEMSDALTPAELGMSYVFDDTLDRFSADMSGWAWPEMFFSSFACELPRAVTYEDDALDKRLRESPFFAPENIRRPRDAEISEYEYPAGYSIIPEDPGTVLDFEKVKAAVEEALKELVESLDLREGGFYSDAEVKSDDPGLNRALEKANRYAGTEIIYRWNGEEEVIDGRLISTWLTIEGDEVNLDEEAVREYVNGLAKKHDTFGRERDFTATDGTVVYTGFDFPDVSVAVKPALEKRLTVTAVTNDYSNNATAINRIVNKAVNLAPFCKDVRPVADIAKLFDQAAAKKDAGKHVPYTIVNMI